MLKKVLLCGANIKDFKDFKELTGKTCKKIKQLDDSMFFYTDGGNYKLDHIQDCCESVEVENVCGELNDLIGSPILLAEEVTSNKNPKDASHDIIKNQCGWETFTWTFYKLSTIKGSVTIRWYGESNGYYSESVDFRKIP